MTQASTGAPERHLASECSSPNVHLCKCDSCVSLIKTHNDQNWRLTCKLCVFFLFTHNNVQHEAFPFYVTQHEQFFQANDSACWDNGCWIKHNVVFIILYYICRLLSEQRRKECVCISKQEEEMLDSRGPPLDKHSTRSIFALQSVEMASRLLEFHVCSTVPMRQCNDH